MAKDVNIHFTVTGNPNGKSLVLLHGWGSDLRTFDPIAAPLEKKFKLYKIDLPGFGKSDPPKKVWGIEDYTVFLEEFVSEHTVKSPILLAHSFGGRIALLYASRNRVHKLILIDAAGIKPKRKLNYYIKVYAYKLSKRAFPLFLGKEKAKQKINQTREQTGSADYNQASGIMRNILVKVVNEDLKYVMPKIEAPTLLIWGENDTATPVKDAQYMEKKIKDCGLAILKNAGHFSFLDKAYEVNLILDNFLQADKTGE